MIEKALISAAERLAARAEKPVDRRAFAADAYHSVCILLCYCQVVLYTTLTGIPLAGPAQWWLTLLQILPAAGLFFFMRQVLKITAKQTLADAFKSTLGPFGAKLVFYLYGALLLLDAWFTLHALTDIAAAYVLKQPQYLPIGLALAAACLLAAATGGMTGTARMVHLFAKPLLLLLVLAVGTAFQIGDPVNLYPYMGPGYDAAAASFLKGSGAVWPIVLMGFAKGSGEKATPTGFKRIPAALLTAMLPILSCCLVLCYDTLMKSGTWASRIVGFLRSAPSKMVWELFLIWAMVLFICGLCGGMAVFGDLVKRKGRGIPIFIFGSALVVLSFFHKDSLTAVFALLMPWRLIAALLPLIAALLSGLIKKKVSA